MKEQQYLPFVYRFRKKIESIVQNDEHSMFDNNRQLWVSKATGEPVVNEFIKLRSSEFGETLITNTFEGVDQSESVNSSDFGETVMTETREGVDQSELISMSYKDKFK